MTSVVIVSGCPGSGKTTVCRALASADPCGLHLVSDVFYEFISHAKDPTTVESYHQNTVVMEALASAASSFARGGYTVYLDGVIGPWFLHVFRPHLEPNVSTSYVVLQLSEVEARARVRRRQGSGLSRTVTQMHRQLSELGPLANHALDTGDRCESEVVEALSERLARGQLILNWSLVAAQQSDESDVE